MILTSGWADALAVTQAEPFPQLPGVPSAPQAGMPELLFTTWSAFYAPRGTPRDIVLKLNKDIIAAGTSPETAAKLDAMAGGPSFTTPEGLMEFTKSEIVAWRKVVRAANIKIE
jgi:tripartite-type tricarboxylate transporter receptor subunit TctC